MTMTPAAAASTSPALDDLAAGLAGRVHAPGSPDYDRLAAAWNAAVPSRPVAVAEVDSAGDVQAVVRWAARQGVRVAVRATGHGAADELDGAVLVHTGRLDELEVTADGRVRAGAGVRWTRVIESTPAGFAPLAGSAPNVGVVGYLTGGGIGPFARSHGLSSDTVRAVELVTGDGELRRASDTEHPELFWGLRGGKGVLGVVTAIEFDLVPMPSLVGGALFFDGVDAAAVLHAWASWSAALPTAATTSVAVLRLPPMPGVPEPLAGRTTVAVRWAWTGDPDEGEAALAPLRSVAPVLFGGTGPMPVQAMGMIHADPVDPMPAVERAAALGALPAEAVDALLALVGPQAECPQVVVELRQLGGAVASGPDCAFRWRDTAYSLVTIGIGLGPGVPAVVRHGRAVAEAMAPWTTGRQLPNFQPGTDAERALRVYGADGVERLAALAEELDPAAVIADSRPVRAARGSA